MRKLAILLALALVGGLMALGRGQVLADDAIDCSDPANAELEECDPTSRIILTSPQDGAIVAPGATIHWTVEAICTGTQQQCQNAGTWVNGPVPDGYIVRIIGPRNSCNQSAKTPLIDEVTTSRGIATGTFTAPSSPVPTGTTLSIRRNRTWPGPHGPTLKAIASPSPSLIRIPPARPRSAHRSTTQTTTTSPTPAFRLGLSSTIRPRSRPRGTPSRRAAPSPSSSSRTAAALATRPARRPWR
jgi:hypothetical protein